MTTETYQTVRTTTVTRKPGPPKALPARARTRFEIISKPISGVVLVEGTIPVAVAEVLLDLFETA